MRKSTFLLVLGLISPVLFENCKIAEKDKDIVVQVDPEFQLGMFEELSQVRDFNLTFQTIEDQSCINNSIGFTSSRNGRNISLHINEIVEAENCLDGQAPIAGDASYDFLPIGVYNLELVLKNTITSTGILTVSNEKYELDIEEGFGFQTMQATLMRVPASTVWGYVAYSDNQYSSDADNFLSELNDQTELLELSKGEYGYFKIGDNKKLSLNKAPDYNNFKTFYRTSNGQVAELETLLEGFRSQYPDGQMEFKIYTWQGETL